MLARFNDAMRLAVLDVGTTSIHLLVVEVAPDRSFRTVESVKDMTRLGQGTLKAGWLSNERIEHATGVIRQFERVARRSRATRVIAVATAAVREAANGREFVARIRRETGLRIRIIDGGEESRLAYLAARHYGSFGRHPALLVDIGGGSTDVVVGTERDMLFARSVPVGALRLHDFFVSGVPVPKRDHRRIHLHLRAALASTLEELHRYAARRAIGMSATLVNIATVLAERSGRPPLASPHGRAFDLRDLMRLHDEMAGANRSDLAAIDGLDPQRHDLALPAACAALEILEPLGIDTLTVCDRGVREGLVIDALARPARRRRIIEV